MLLPNFFEVLLPQFIWPPVVYSVEWSTGSEL